MRFAGKGGVEYVAQVPGHRLDGDLKAIEGNRCVRQVFPPIQEDGHRLSRIENEATRAHPVAHHRQRIIGASLEYEGIGMGDDKRQITSERR